MSDKIVCLKCGSDQLTANKKGFSGKKAVAGAVLTGGLGLLAGTIGSNSVKVTCLACGNSWDPKEYAQKKVETARYNSELQHINDNRMFKVTFATRYKSGDIEGAQALLEKSDMYGRFKTAQEAYEYLQATEGANQPSQGGAIAVFIAVIIIIIVVVLIATK